MYFFEFENSWGGFFFLLASGIYALGVRVYLYREYNILNNIHNHVYLHYFQSGL